MLGWVWIIEVLDVYYFYDVGAWVGHYLKFYLLPHPSPPHRHIFFVSVSMEIKICWMFPKYLAKMDLILILSNFSGQ